MTLIKALQQFKRGAFLHIFSILPNHRQAAHAAAFHTGRYRPHHYHHHRHYRFHLHYRCHHHHHYCRCVDCWYCWILIRPVFQLSNKNCIKLGLGNIKFPKRAQTPISSTISNGWTYSPPSYRFDYRSWCWWGWWWRSLSSFSASSS